MRIAKCLVLTLLAGLLPLSAASAQNDAAGARQISDDLIERIEILGKRPVFYYKTQYREKRDDFLDLYNELVEDRDNIIKCKMQLQGTSKIKREYCNPAYVSLQIFRETQFNVARGVLQGAENVYSPVLFNKLDARKQKMVTSLAQLINDNPELRQRYLTFYKARSDYELMDSYFARQLQKDGKLLQ